MSTTDSKSDALSEKNGSAAREKREAWCQDARGGGSPADQRPLSPLIGGFSLCVLAPDFPRLRESDDVERVFSSFAQSDNNFDVWFKGRVKEITGVDLNEPGGPLPEVIFDWPS
jgi:hypothetical protein